MAKQVGLGTAIRKVTRRLGIPHCRSCQQRQRILDRAVPSAWPPPGLKAWLESRAKKKAKREAQAQRNAHGA